MDHEQYENTADLLSKHFENKARIKALEENIAEINANLVLMAKAFNNLVSHLVVEPEPTTPDEPDTGAYL